MSIDELCGWEDFRVLGLDWKEPELSCHYINSGAYTKAKYVQFDLKWLTLVADQPIGGY